MTRLQILFAFLTTLLAATPALAVYSPELGRFRTRDPAGYVGGGNLYEYVGSEPMKKLDPMGLQPQLPFNPDAGGIDPPKGPPAESYDSRNDPAKGCGITVGQNPGVTGHSWITIDDPNSRKMHFGFWPKPGKKKMAYPFWPYPGFVYDPTYNGPFDVHNDDHRLAPFDDPSGETPDPGATFHDVHPFVTEWERERTPDGYEVGPHFPVQYPGTLPDGSPTSQASCDVIRRCVIRELRKYANTTYEVTTNNCRAVDSVLKNCGLSRAN